MFQKFFYTGLATVAAALFTSLAVPATAAAQPLAPQIRPVASPSVSLGTPEVSLNDWRYHPGDSPLMQKSKAFLWADPAFDDSDWRWVKAELLPAQNVPYSQFFWYRRRVNINRQNPAQKLAVLLEITNTYEVYWNGQLLGSLGRVPPRINWPYRTMKSFSLPLPDQPSIVGVLAVRVWCEPPSLNFDSCGFVEPRRSFVRPPLDWRRRASTTSAEAGERAFYGNQRISGGSVASRAACGNHFADRIAFSVFRHFIAERRQQEHNARELHAAQEVQRVLVPDKLPTVPGFALASVYRPASEVGGDFFQILPLESGATLVVIGDVSGKGLKAAMIVSLIVGTLRTVASFTEDPAEILKQLNARLHRRMPGGFVTCLVLRIDVGGRIVAAHAGHIFPYIDGKEFALAGSVPLGVMTETDYDQTELHLAKGETLTLLTDGVPEAQNTKKELFGFDRLATLLAGKPTAERVAETACSFGQQDDITVLTLTRLVASDDSRVVAFNLAAQEA